MMLMSLLMFHQMAAHDCQTLAGSLLGFLTTRAASPLVSVHVFHSIFSKFTNLNGQQSFCVLMLFMYHMWVFQVKIVKNTVPRVGSGA